MKPIVNVGSSGVELEFIGLSTDGTNFFGPMNPHSFYDIMERGGSGGFTMSATIR
jgi:hypothetical protein